MDFTEQSPVSLSVCPGLLGIERGLKRVFPRLRTAAYVEIETFIVENILSAMESGLVDAAPIWTNLKTFNPEPFRGQIDILLGGYPCQPFSLAGNRGGDTDPRHLWPYLFKIAGTIKPLCCFFENVSGHLSMGYDQVYRDLRSLGYRVESGIYTASEVGAPHQRERLFILAILGDTGRESLERSGFRSGIDTQGWGEQNGQVIKSSGSRSLGNSQSFNQRNERDEYRGSERKNRRSGSELADTRYIGCDRWNSDNDTREVGTMDAKEKDWANIHREIEGCGYKLADTCNNGCDGSENRQSINQRERGDQTGSDKFFESSGFSSAGNHDRFPAGQGAFQYDWEEPRTIEFPLVNYVNGNKTGSDILYINHIYETYTTKKLRSIERLSELWSELDSKKLQWTIGGLYCFLEAEILLTNLHGTIQNKRFTHRLDTLKKVQNIQKGEMRELWIGESIGSSPQGQEQIKQLRREFADVMCILSYQASLGRRQDTQSGNHDETVRYLWENYENAWWDVPETLSAVQKIWGPVSDKARWRIQIEEAYKGYRLELFGNVFGYNFTEDLHRAIGNSVVEQTAELAFRDLLRKHYPV